MLVALVWMAPVSAEDSAEEIVAMMDWWEEYGRYWEETGMDVSGEEDSTFAWLASPLLPVQETVQ